MKPLNPIAVSVIIPIYNGQSDLPDLLQSLYAQAYDRDRVEYLIIDNGSQDNTWNALKQAEIEAQADSFPLKILQEPKIQGSYAARNQGIQAATAEILAFTDADCRPEPDWLTNLMQPFDSNLTIDSGSNSANLGWVAGEVSALPSKIGWNAMPIGPKLSRKNTPSPIPFRPMAKPLILLSVKFVLGRLDYFAPI